MFLPLLYLALVASTVAGEVIGVTEVVTDGTKQPNSEIAENDGVTTAESVANERVTMAESAANDGVMENNGGAGNTGQSTGYTVPTTIETTTEEELGFINILDMDDDSRSTSFVIPTTSESTATTSDQSAATTSDQSAATTSDQSAATDGAPTSRTVEESSTTENVTAGVSSRKERLSEQIRAVISHYKKYGTVTIPDASIPDPMTIPNIKRSIAGSEVTFTNCNVYGLSNFTIEHVNTDLDKMQVYVAIYIRRLIILGNYTSKIFFKKVAGPFNATLLYVEASGAAELVRDDEGTLQASESEMDMTFLESKVKFGNMGLMGTLLQGVVASAGPVLFDSIKPFILTEINKKVREDVNKKIKTIGSKFINSGTKPPLDVALEEARKYVKEKGYDPYYINNYVWKYTPKNQSILNVNISRISLTGLSNFRRVGEVSLSMDSGTVQMGLHLATSKLKGKCLWTVALGKYVRSGHTNFTVDYVQGRGLVNQSLDVSQHPVLEDLDINVGKVKIQMKGTGPLDLVVEAVVNTLPDLIRHMIVDAIELPLKYAVQHILSDIKVEELLDQQLPELDKMGL